MLSKFLLVQPGHSGTLARGFEGAMHKRGV